MDDLDSDAQKAMLEAYDNSQSLRQGLTLSDVNDAANVLGMSAIQSKHINAMAAIGLEVETQGVVRMGLGMVLMSTNSQLKALKKIEEKLDRDEFDCEPDQLIAAAKVAGELGKNIASNGETLVKVAKEGLVKEKKTERTKFYPPPPGIAMQVHGNVHVSASEKDSK